MEIDRNYLVSVAVSFKDYGERINHMKEIEAKLKLENPSIIERANLIEVKNIRVIDIYFDSDFLNLKSEDKVLRLRNENDKSYIAFKGAREKHNDLVIRA